jgi:hypothetical protein
MLHPHRVGQIGSGGSFCFILAWRKRKWRAEGLENQPHGAGPGQMLPLRYQIYLADFLGRVF